MRRFLRRHSLAAALVLAVVGLALFAYAQRAQIDRIDSNSHRISAIQQQQAVNQWDEDRRLFRSCVRVAILRHHVNGSTTAIRGLLGPIRKTGVAATGRKLTRKELRQLDTLLKAVTLAPGPETREACLTIAPPPQGPRPTPPDPKLLPPTGDTR